MEMRLLAVWGTWLFASCFYGTSSQIVSQAGDKCSRHYVCPPEYLRLSQHCYYFSKNATTWQNAFFSCNELHGKLAILRNAHQDKMLQSFLKKVAIGLTFELGVRRLEDQAICRSARPLRYPLGMSEGILESILQSNAEALSTELFRLTVTSVRLPTGQASVERWIGGMYDWEQMTWKWMASGKEIKYKGFADVIPDNKEELKWHCIVLDPQSEYKWNTRSCLEEKHYICQTKLRKVNKKGKKKLQRQFNTDKYRKLNEVPVPDIPEYNQSAINWKEHVPQVIANYIDSNSLSDNNAFANNPNATVATFNGNYKNRRNRKNKRKCNHIILANGTVYDVPQLKYGKRRRRKNSKENSSIEEIQTKIYYSSYPKSPLHPRVITEELSFP